ncbi:MAG: 6,7-dimethyl-8-ribityllumazine synthase [Ferrovibrio sp.]|uniref:6,7-dimethyl-8-ribityllumazine synthase n=1 Tax=Ferrovibrio sp. TaxID=1917215 RepID=UPI003918DE32
MNQSQAEHTSSSFRLDAGGSQAIRVAFVQSCWHRDIVDKAWDSFLAEMGRAGLRQGSIDRFELPGAFEIPLQAKLLAQGGRYQAIVAAGFVVDGGIYRHDFVADAVIKGLMQVQLETGVPVLSCVLTPLRFHEHEEHRRFFADHFVVKGREVALACAATLKNIGSIRKAA